MNSQSGIIQPSLSMTGNLIIDEGILLGRHFLPYAHLYCSSSINEHKNIAMYLFILCPLRYNGFTS